MHSRVDEKGKFFTQRVTKDVVRSYVRTADYIVVGNVHVRPDQRIKDELDRDTSRFLPITDAIVYEAATSRQLYQTDFLLLTYQHVVMISPIDAFGEAGNAPWHTEEAEV